VPCCAFSGSACVGEADATMTFGPKIFYAGCTRVSLAAETRCWPPRKTRLSQVHVESRWKQSSARYGFRFAQQRQECRLIASRWTTWWGSKLRPARCTVRHRAGASAASPSPFARNTMPCPSSAPGAPTRSCVLASPPFAYSAPVSTMSNSSMGTTWLAHPSPKRANIEFMNSL
jgi:hypothetical protein